MTWMTVLLFTDYQSKPHRIQVRDIAESQTTKVRWQYEREYADEWFDAWVEDAKGYPEVHEPAFSQFSNYGDSQ